MKRGVGHRRWLTEESAFRRRALQKELDLPERLSGAALMYAGLTLPRMLGDWPSVQIHLQRVDPDENDEPAES